MAELFLLFLMLTLYGTIESQMLSDHEDVLRNSPRVVLKSPPLSPSSSMFRQPTFRHSKNDVELFDMDSLIVPDLQSPSSIKFIPESFPAQVNEFGMGFADGWGQWSDWSTCSSTCGRGLTQRSRFCLKRPFGAVSSPCQGFAEQYKVCEMQSCGESSQDFHQYQCSQHNNDLMQNSKTYTWEAYHVDEAAPCTVACVDKNYNFFQTFGRALDGTACGRDMSGVCMSGTCKNVGCDGIIGSKVSFDECGVCGGDNSTCYHVYDTFQTFPGGTEVKEYDYNEVTIIESGAANIFVKDYSANYLALMVSTEAGDRYVINGDFIVSMPGSVEVAGTIAKYSREGDNEVIEIKGPIKENIHIMVLSYGSDPLIEYDFWVSLGKRNSFNEPEKRLQIPQQFDGIEDLLAAGLDINSVEMPTEFTPRQHKKTTTTTVATTTTTTRPTTTSRTRNSGQKPTCQCRRQFNKRKNFCRSDFVIRAKILYRHRGNWGKYVRHSVEISTTFKSGFTLLKREYVWIANSCCMPRLNKSYVLSGRKINLTAKGKNSKSDTKHSRLIVDFTDYWFPWKKTYQRKLGKYSSRRFCQRRESSPRRS